MIHSAARFDLMHTVRYTRSDEDAHSHGNITYPNLEWYQGIHGAAVGPNSSANPTATPDEM